MDMDFEKAMNFLLQMQVKHETWLQKQRKP
jgi:hypothetical protein